MKIYWVNCRFLQCSFIGWLAGSVGSKHDCTYYFKICPWGWSFTNYCWLNW